MRGFLLCILSLLLLLAQGEGLAATKKEKAKPYPTGSLQAKPGSATTAGQPAVHPTVQYVECSELSQSQPDKALAMIEASPAQSADPSIQHCKAMSLYNLGRFREAGDLLNQLSVQYEKARVPLALDLLQQAYRAWQMAEDKQQVRHVLNRAVSVSLLNHQTQLAQYWLEERAGWLLEQDPARAVQDWDHLLNYDARRAPWLVGRAQAFDKLGQKKLARQDYKQALLADPANKEAKAALTGK